MRSSASSTLGFLGPWLRPLRLANSFECRSLCVLVHGFNCELWFHVFRKEMEGEAKGVNIFEEEWCGESVPQCLTLCPTSEQRLTNPKITSTSHGKPMHPFHLPNLCAISSVSSPCVQIDDLENRVDLWPMQLGLLLHPFDSFALRSLSAKTQIYL